MELLIKLGYIENRWSWEYDTSIVTAKLYLDPKNGNIFLDVIKLHIKSGLGKGRFETHVGDYNVGTLKKPDRGLIGKILRDNKQQKPFPRNGWNTKDKTHFTLKEFFEEIYQGDNDIARSLKLSELKKRISKMK